MKRVDLRVVTGRGVVLALALAAAAAPGGAQAAELTALAGLRVGGEFEDTASGAAQAMDESLTLGLVLGFPLDRGRTLEIVWTHQPLDVPTTGIGTGEVGLRLDTLGVGGTYEWGEGRLRPFVSATVGLTLLSPDAADLDAELLFAGTLGGGVKVPISGRLGLRLEGRGVAMLTTGSAAGVCGGGGCVLGFSGSGIAQLELLAGLAYSF
jgi:hypothetical protein